MVVKIVAVIGGALVGLVVGSFIKLIVMTPIKNGSSMPDDTNTALSAVITLVCMAVGAWMFYRRFVRSRS